MQVRVAIQPARLVPQRFRTTGSTSDPRPTLSSPLVGRLAGWLVAASDHDSRGSVALSPASGALASIALASLVQRCVAAACSRGRGSTDGPHSPAARAPPPQVRPPRATPCPQASDPFGQRAPSRLGQGKQRRLLRRSRFRGRPSTLVVRRARLGWPKERESHDRPLLPPSPQPPPPPPAPPSCRAARAVTPTSSTPVRAASASLFVDSCPSCSVVTPSDS